MNTIEQKERVVAKKAGGLWHEFKQFALKGNVMDLAIAVVIGTAFSKIVNALVTDIIQPLIGLISNTDSLQNASVVLRATSTPATGGPETPAIILNYGDFLGSIESFIIVAGSIFLVVKLISTARNRLFRKEATGEAPPPPKSE